MSQKRDHLLAVALDLFHREGFHNVGIDRILSEAGVAKMTLYNHFPSKQALILECLKERDHEARQWFRHCVESRASDPYERLLVLFDAVAEKCGKDDYPGCLFLNACAQYTERDSPIRAAAAEHKRMMTRYIHELCDEAGYQDAGELSQQLSILLDGVMARSALVENKRAAVLAKQVARVLLESTPKKTG
ncbi:MAG: TetR/AcrR family transcriptional regulator [Phycisphaerales bacterium JB043]